MRETRGSRRDRRGATRAVWLAKAKAKCKGKLEVEEELPVQSRRL